MVSKNWLKLQTLFRGIIPMEFFLHSSRHLHMSAKKEKCSSISSGQAAGTVGAGCTCWNMQTNTCTYKAEHTSCKNECWVTVCRRLEIGWINEFSAIFQRPLISRNKPPTKTLLIIFNELYILNGVSVICWFIVVYWLSLTHLIERICEGERKIFHSADMVGVRTDLGAQARLQICELYLAFVVVGVHGTF